MARTKQTARKCLVMAAPRKMIGRGKGGVSRGKGGSVGGSARSRGGIPIEE